MKIISEGGDADDFRKMFENVDSVTDIPACFFWEEILEAFPDAKVSKLKYFLTIKIFSSKIILNQSYTYN